MTTVYERLKALQITLPDVSVPVVAGYGCGFRSVCAHRQSCLFVRTPRKERWQALVRQNGGANYHTRGQTSRTRHCHRIARHAAISPRGPGQDKTDREAAGDGDSTPNSTEPHVVANGASELFLEIFGERGAHARSTFGSAQIPFGACVEIDLIAEVIDRADAPKGT